MKSAIGIYIFGNGISDGKSDARQDFINSHGTDKNNKCSPEEHTDGYCTLYKIACEAQWGYMWLQYDCTSGECQ